MLVVTLGVLFAAAGAAVVPRPVPFERAIFPNLPNVVHSSENAICEDQTELYLKHLENFTIWAEESE